MCRVSFIVPVYNVEKYLRRCLDSLLDQTINDYEIICVNDCSSDQSALILKEYQTKHPEKIRVINNSENMGQGRSRTRALNEALGKYVCFVDSDDYVKKDYLESYLKIAEEEDCDLVIGGFVRDVEGDLKEHLIEDSDWSLLTYTVAWAKMFRKAFLIDHDIDFSEKRQGEDIYFSVRVYYGNPKYHVIQYAGYYYYNNKNSTTGKMNYTLNFERTVADMFDLFMQKCNLAQISQEKQWHIEYDYLANMINALITYGHGCKPAKMREKYNFYLEDRKMKFPQYAQNPYIGLMKPKGQTFKIRTAVGLIMLLERIHLGRLFFWIISWL